MNRVPNIPRLLIEIVALVASIEAAIMYMLPIVAPNADNVARAVLDTGILTLVVGPLILWRVVRAVGAMNPTEVRHESASARPAVAASIAILAIGIAVTVVMSIRLRNEADNEARMEFTRLADKKAGELERRAQLPLYGLRSVAGLFESSDTVSKTEFESHIRSLDVAGSFPGVLGFGYIEPVKRGDRAAFEATLREEYGPEASIKSPGGVQDSYIIRRIEPVSRNLASLGLDVGAEVVGREAIERVLETGEPAITGPIRLVQGRKAGNEGLLFLSPVYSHGPAPTSADERRQRLIGLAYAPIAIDEMFAGVDSESGDRIDCEVFDGDAGSGLLFFDADGRVARSSPIPRKFFDERQMSVGGRRWTLCMSSRPKFEEALAVGPWPYAAVGGGVLSLSLAMLVWTVGASRQRAVKLAEVMTCDLFEAKVAAEASLREVQALRGTLNTHAMVSVTDGAGVIIDVNDNFCRISGYSRDELIGRTHAIVNSGHHPKQFWASMWKTVISGNPWRGEVCNRAKDGSVYWVDSMIAPYKGQDGSIERLVSIRSDITQRKLQEQALRESSERSRYTGLLARVGWWSIDVDSKTLAWSDQVKEMHEVGPDYRPDIPGALAFYDAEWSRVIADRLQATIERQVPFDIELPLTTAKARALWVRVIGEPVIARGRVVSVAGAIQDITEQVRQRDAIRAQALQMDLTVRASGLGTWNITWPSGEMRVSDLWLAMLGTGADGAPASLSDWEAMVHPEDLGPFQRELGDHLRGKTPEFRIEHRTRRQDGDWVWVMNAGKVIERDAGGNPRLLSGVQIDLTVQKQAIAQVRRSRQQLRSLLDSAGEGIYSIDSEGRCTSCNPAALRLLGFERESDLLGKPMHELTHHTHSDGSVHHPADCPINQAGRSGLTSVVDRDVFWRADGTPQLVEYRAYPQSDAGKIVGVVVLFTDVTIKLELEREAAEASARLEYALVRAESANHAKSEFLANMSHEIRTPLTAILGYAEVLRDDPEISANPLKLRHSLDTIRSAGQHLMTIINDVLDLSKIEAGKMTVERVDTPLPGLLLEIESLMRSRAGAKGVALNVRLTTPIPDLIESDPTRVRQILVNLVGNAIKFTGHGAVTISAGVHPRGSESILRIDVQDSGAGMDSEQRSRLFQTFSQADSKVTRQFGGTGLGLAISRRLARLMDGDVSLVWTEPGKGSCFRVELPLIVAPGAKFVSQMIEAAKPEAQSASSLTTLWGRILLAEDGPDNQRLIAFYLSKAGAQVEIAENGRFALEKIKAAADAGTPFDLLLTDMQMPEMDGYTLAAELRRNGSNIPIVALTAHAMAEDRQQCLDAGCDDYASKPVDRAHLLKTCAAWMRARPRAAA